MARKQTRFGIRFRPQAAEILKARGVPTINKEGYLTHPMVDELKTFDSTLTAGRWIELSYPRYMNHFGLGMGVVVADVVRLD